MMRSVAVLIDRHGASLRRDQRGAVVVEHLVAFLHVMFFFLVTLQIIDLAMADLVLRSAAWSAARAASVILPANPIAYGGVPKDQFAGAKRDAVVTAARMVLQANSHCDPASVHVSVTGNSGSGPVTATVRATYQCRASFVNVVCGGSSRELTHSASDVYQSAPYPYE